MLTSETYGSLIKELLRHNRVASTYEIYDFIESSTKSAKSRELVGIDWKKSVRGVIRTLEKKGELKRIKRGQYELLE